MTSLRGLPALSIALGGSPLPTARMQALVSLRVTQQLSLPAQCELVFLLDRERRLDGLELGAALRIEVGSGALLFAGELTAVEVVQGAGQPARVFVRGYDVLHRLRKRASPRVVRDLTVLEIARQLTEDLSVEVRSERELPRFSYLMQGHEHDFAWLARVCERSGSFFTLHDETLTLCGLDGVAGTLGLALGESLLEAAVELNAETACSAVSVSGWDLTDACEIGASTDDGASVSGAPSSPWPTPTVQLGDRPVSTPDQARAEAGAELERRTAGTRVLRGVAFGDSRLRPGTRADVRGLGAELDGVFVLTRVTHTCDAERGFLSELSSEPPEPTRTCALGGTLLGTVTNVDDPAARGRVRVRLHALGDLESDWLQVLSPAAGANKGLRMLPDVDDRVLLAVHHDDPARAVVLGGLHDRRGSADPGVENGAVRRFSLLSPGGHKIQLDDGDHTLTISDANGSAIELTREHTRISSRTKLVLEAPGHGVVIRGHTIDFERA